MYVSCNDDDDDGVQGWCCGQHGSSPFHQEPEMIIPANKS